MTPPIADTAPLIVTERLELWRPRAGDQHALLTMMESEEMRRFLGARPATMPDEAMRLLRNAGSWALYGYGCFVCRRRGEDAVAAIAGVFHSWRGYGDGLDDTPEAGWIVAQPLWGQGYASEAMAAAMAWFDGEIGRRRISCMVEDGNTASLRMAAKLGFERYGSHRPEGAERELVLLERI